MTLVPRNAPWTSALSVLTLAFITAAGCSPTAAPIPSSGEPTAAETDGVPADTLVRSAVEVLQSSKRSPKAHELAAQRLNQYLAKAQAAGESPVSELPTNVKNSLLGRLTAQQIQLIENRQFERPDAIHLEGCFLLRDTVNQIIAGSRDKPGNAQAIFDWVIRNVQLAGDTETARVPLPPPVTVLLGRGNQAERAWTFMELLRQAEIDSVLLAHMEMTEDGKQRKITPWVPAAVWDDSLYLFDTTLGLPVPGPDGQPVATLKQVIDNPSLLDSLSPDAKHPYGVRPKEMSEILVLLESTPFYWAPRMRFLQQSLAGEQHAVLWSDLVALAEHVRRATSDSTAQELWLLPRATNEMSFSKEYSDAILGTREEPIGVLTPYQFLSPAEARTAHLQGRWTDAIPIYMANRVQFEQWISSDRNHLGMRAIVANALGAEVAGPNADAIAREIATKVAANAAQLYATVREDCTYFLGVAKFEQHDYKSATNWLGRSYLDKYPDGRWTDSARYHLGRCAELQGDTPKAIEHYTTPIHSLQYPGNLVRARRLGWTPDTDASDDAR